MAKLQEKGKAIQLRKQGQSIQEIAERVGISKSTVSLWCRDVSLNKMQIQRLVVRQKSGSYKGRIKAAEIKRSKRLKEENILRKEGIKEIGKISKRDLFVAGIAMYLSEGYTYSGGTEVGFVNSDPKLILFMLRWFEEICKIPKARLTLSVRINNIHNKRVGQIEKYWSELTGVPLSQFNKTIFIKTNSKKVYQNSENYFGTLRIIVKQGTKLRRKINGWIEGILKSV